MSSILDQPPRSRPNESSPRSQRNLILAWVSAALVPVAVLVGRAASIAFLAAHGYDVDEEEPPGLGLEAFLLLAVIVLVPVAAAAWFGLHSASGRMAVRQDGRTGCRRGRRRARAARSPPVPQPLGGLARCAGLWCCRRARGRCGHQGPRSRRHAPHVTPRPRTLCSIVLGMCRVSAGRTPTVLGRGSRGLRRRRTGRRGRPRCVARLPAGRARRSGGSWPADRPAS